MQEINDSGDWRFVNFPLSGWFDFFAHKMDKLYAYLNRLIVLSDFPDAGKTTIACELARQLKAVHVRMDCLNKSWLEVVAVLIVFDEPELHILAGPRLNGNNGDILGSIE